MIDLERYYDERTNHSVEGDFLGQVGHTENGVAIGPEQFDQLVAEISDQLQIQPQDRLLDLCCGNGFISHRLASQVESVVGIDLSSQLIKIADRYHRRNNTRFEVGDVRKLDTLAFDSERPFSKVLIFAALQHFSYKDFDLLIRNILKISDARPTIMIGFIPEQGKKLQFYDSFARRIRFLWWRLIGRDLLGTWWSRTQIAEHCERFGLECEFHSIDSSLKASRYRFNVTIRPADI